MACAAKLYKYVSHSRPGNPFFAISPLTIRPVGAKGDSEPALAPLPTMMAIRKAGILARPATLMAMGASNAEVAMLPGPMEASAAATRKNRIGIRPVLPWQMRTA